MWNKACGALVVRSGGQVLHPARVTTHHSDSQQDSCHDEANDHWAAGRMTATLPVLEPELRADLTVTAAPSIVVRPFPPAAGVTSSVVPDVTTQLGRSVKTVEQGVLNGPGDSGEFGPRPEHRSAFSEGGGSRWVGG
ncbi:hypothetical protein Drose_03710 [Dactylosporangium roseum]|uniref:Uncharacterized protein n=1 Tax=Dactylosporangium roseum TaxID=47989 RepID=A0ABY5Z5R9_9ACTN|nr:hypothetical protein [Dactylosporangium roseum]UWZ37400.1 hypothetical protein Drose_03710 [Dactylosporangium roseum]